MHKPYAVEHSQPHEHTCNEAHAQSAQFPARPTQARTISCDTSPWGTKKKSVVHSNILAGAHAGARHTTTAANPLPNIPHT